MQFEILTTNRLSLRKITLDVFDFVYQNYSDNELIPFLGLNNQEELEKEKSKYKNGLCTFNKSFLYFQLIDKNSDKIIGWCGYHTWYLDHARAEIGYGLFDDNFKNKGIMTEAINVILDYGFTIMKLHRIEAFIGTNNIPSLQLVKKFEFINEGVLRSHYFKNNIMEDSVVFSLLKEEFKMK
jgi:[ribosomal protein S5]-alanine N-acetyltransferase